jgi:hypothetical protein
VSIPEDEAMTITLNISPEAEAKLQQKAVLRGLTILELMELLVNNEIGQAVQEPLHSLHELRGLGAETWRLALAGHDAQEYIRAERDEWEL